MEAPPPLTPAERVSRLIERLQVTPFAFAKTCGLSHQTISNVLSGKNKPGFDTLEAIANRFPDTSAWLLTGEGAPFPNGRYNEKQPVTEKQAATTEPEGPEPPAGAGALSIVPESAELRQVKSERDHLRRQNELLLDIVGNRYGRPYDYNSEPATASTAAAPGKLSGSEQAAAPKESAGFKYGRKPAPQATVFMVTVRAGQELAKAVDYTERLTSLNAVAGAHAGYPLSGDAA